MYQQSIILDGDCVSEKANNNDGIFDSVELIDTLIVDCNDVVKQVVSGNYVLFCMKIVEMVQKLSRLKDGVSNDTQYLKQEIFELKKANDDLYKIINSTEKGV